MKKSLLSILFFLSAFSYTTAQSNLDSLILSGDSGRYIFNYVGCGIHQGDVFNLLIEKQIIEGLYFYRKYFAIQKGYIDFADLNSLEGRTSSEGKVFSLVDFILTPQNLILLTKISNIKYLGIWEKSESISNETDSIFVLVSIEYESLNPLLRSNDISVLKVGRRSIKRFSMLKKRNSKQTLLSYKDCVSYYQEVVPDSLYKENIIASRFRITAMDSSCNQQLIFEPTQIGFFGIVFSNQNYFSGAYVNRGSVEVFYLNFDIKNQKFTSHYCY